MKSTHLTKVFQESFRIITAFKQKKDTQALRHYTDPMLLCQWQEEWDSWVATSQPYEVEKFEVGKIWFDVNGVTVEFHGTKISSGKITEFSDHWTFKKSGDRWLVSKILVGFVQEQALAA